MSLMGNFAGIRSQADGSGDAGNILVDVGTLTLSGGAVIGTSTTRPTATGRAGNVTVIATEAITLAGQRTEIGSTTRGISDAGQVFVSASVLRLQEGARIRTEALQEIETNPLPQGNAGDITVQVGTLTFTGRASILSSTAGAGRAGNITLNVGSLVAQEATLTSSSTGAATGNAGTVLIQGPGGPGTFATRITLTGSVVATEASVADGGDIQVRAQDTLRLRDSQMTTAVRSGQGRGGNIFIDPAFIILERSQIRADAFGGPGGNIRIIAQGFVADAASQVSASSERNVEGRIDIQAAITPNGLVAPVPLVFASAAALLRSPCAARLHEGTVSTLVERGRDWRAGHPGWGLAEPAPPGPAGHCHPHPRMEGCRALPSSGPWGRASATPAGRSRCGGGRRQRALFASWAIAPPAEPARRHEWPWRGGGPGRTRTGACCVPGALKTAARRRPYRRAVGRQCAGYHSSSCAPASALPAVSAVRSAPVPRGPHYRW